MSGFAYLACPYSHSLQEVMQRRYELVTRYAAELAEQGIAVYSPITQGHAMAPHISNERVRSWKFWQDMDSAFVAACEKLIVLQLDGWEKSAGVTAEIELARSFDKPVEFHRLVGK